ncbi:phosphatidate cytidylyltransferase [bacterium]|nr:phosphatidate cytidylyltransferase [bacterium]
MKHSETIKRLAVAAVAIPLIIGASLQGGVLFVLYVCIVAAGSFYEFHGFFRKGQGPLTALPGIVVLILICFDLYATAGKTVLLYLFILFMYETIRLIHTGAFEQVRMLTATITGLIYSSFFAVFILIRELPSLAGWSYRTGGYLVLLVFSGIWILDSSAYFVGSSVKRRHAMSAVISPNKSWEGAAAGFLAAVLAVLLLGRVWTPTLTLSDLLVVGGIIGVFGQVSDLSESLFKRATGIKDSSHIIPGHGGILDRFDSSLLVAPICYLYLALKYVHGFIS